MGSKKYPPLPPPPPPFEEGKGNEGIVTSWEMTVKVIEFIITYL